MMLDGAECYARMALTASLCARMPPIAPTVQDKAEWMSRSCSKTKLLCCPPLPWLPTERVCSHGPPRLNYSKVWSRSNEETWFDTKAGGGK